MKAVIVGGGVGGMISALLLRKEGFEVTVIEKNEKLGGRLSYVKRDGFKVDAGPTIVLLPEMLQSILDEAGVSREKYTLNKLDSLYTIHYSDGSAYTKYSDIEKQAEEIRKIFPEDENGFRRFMEDMDTRFNIGKPAFLEKSFTAKKSFWTRENMRTLAKLKAYQTVYQSLKSYFSSEKLRHAYSLQTLYIGGNPYESPALYSLVSFSEHKHGVFYLSGGYARLAEVLEETMQEEGIEILSSTEAESVELSGMKAAGVKVNGRLIEGDYVILNGDFPIATKLLPDKSLHNKRYKASSSCALIYFGLNKIYKDAPVHQFFLSENFALNMKQIFKSRQIPDDPSVYAFHPSVIDPSLAPEGKGVLYALVPVPSGNHLNWEQQEAFFDSVIDKLEEKGFPGLRDAVEWVEYKTPAQAEKEGLFEGGSFGIAPNLFQSGVFRPQVRPFGIPNVFAVGASIHPGGGIPIVMQGAKLMVQELQNDAFQTKGVKASG
ncbi:phytoene desaturase [Bacillus lacus]|uniref:Phytoene desaturase n=1 Tax=Metabacillus lacus TaxID=1983721 RepID=A0A7X2LZK0_9BACI|nr:phytoene desaturase family protein [Metabacillus lacus]MRX73506.1 phytoene desaturase [Metabacillus lacus]